MANISNEIRAFQNAVYGEEVRSSMISAIQKINTVTESCESTVNSFSSNISSATTAANNAASNANTAATNANNAATAANTAKNAANTAASNANAAVTSANNAASNASAAATSANNAEAARVTAENARANAESTRQANESARQSAEQARVSAEATRANSEATRESAESARQTNEITRQGNERQRQNSETLRENAESSRASGFSDMQAAFADMQRTVIPQATESTMGGVIVGDGLSVDNALLSLAETKSGSGTSVFSNGSYLESLTVYGESVQDDTPTPDAPVPVQVVEGPLSLVIGDASVAINLQGNTLASLPDGTRDELHVDSTGHCVLTKNVGKTTIDDSLAFGSSFIDSDTMRGNCTRITMNMSNFPTMKSVALSAANSYMSIAVAGSTSASAAPYPGVYSKTAASGVYLTLPSTLTSASDVTAWLTDNNFDFFYPLATPQTIDLGYIDPPAIPEDGAMVSVSASITPVIDVSWWESGAAPIALAISKLIDEIKSLKAQIAALATS